MNIKICGLTRSEDVRCAVEYGADMLGFMFYPPSPRCLDLDTAPDLIGEVPAGIERVGVFVDQPADVIREIVARCGLTTVQLHGGESPADASALAEQVKVIKAVAPTNVESLDNLEAFGDGPILLDTPSPEHGGTGVTGDWDLAHVAARLYDIILAGGLTSRNVKDAIVAVQPWGVDVSSGVESAPGIKSCDSIREFIAAARRAEPITGETE